MGLTPKSSGRPGAGRADRPRPGRIARPGVLPGRAGVQV